MANLIPCGTCGYPLTLEERTGLVEVEGEMVKPAQKEPVSGVVIREGLPTLLRDHDIKPTDTRLYTHTSTTQAADG